MKKIAAITWCTDDYAQYLKPEKLKKSINYFHPEIDFYVIDSKQSEKIKEENPWLVSEKVKCQDWIKVIACLPYVEEYDMIILLDSDCICIGSLDKVIQSDKELIGVRNNNFFGKAGAAQPCVVPFYEPYGDGGMIGGSDFVNAGFVASNDKQFWYEWRDFNKFVAEQSDCRTFTFKPWPLIRNEQDTWNHIFHAKDKYTTEIIDREGCGVTYGIVNSWGQTDHWESWKKLYVKNDQIFIDHPTTGEPLRTSILHAAGVDTMETVKPAGDLYQWICSIVSEEVSDYIRSIVGD